MTVRIEQARAALANGDLIGAYDGAERGLVEGEPAGPLHYVQVLALARMGDRARAIERYDAYRLDASSDIDVWALRARLLKDEALAAPAAARAELLDRASAAYLAVHERTGGYFPGINAATLAQLAGRVGDARTLAAQLLDRPELEAPADYFAAATRAEALLLCGRIDEAATAIRVAAAMRRDDHGARSSTVRQLDLLADAIGLDAARHRALLAPLRPPAVAMFCGHIFAADAAVEAPLAARIEVALAEHRIGFVYGALACGADILIAETVLKRGGELNVVLPFPEEDFVRYSVETGGAGWVERFHACMARAASVTRASTIGYVGDPGQFAHGTRIAMGLATLRARHLGAEVAQLAVWDRSRGGEQAGTAADVAAWAETGAPTWVVEPGPIDRAARQPPPIFPPQPNRALRAMIFTDFPGFSRLPELALPLFWEEVMGRIARILDRYGDDICYRNSWGDALFAVARTPAAAAGVTLELAAALATLDHERLGVPAGTSMRVGAHYGPVYHAMDPVARRETFYGTEVSLAARIEPVTPPGSVYITEPLAAMLALEPDGRYRPGYVGRVALPKGYGTFPMYRLERTAD